MEAVKKRKRPIPYSHCMYCGTEYGHEDWPRVCPDPECRSAVWRNPLPVCVVLMRIGDGFLGVRRGIDPGRGKLALPGGFHNYGELWQTAMVRELREETGIVVPESGVHLFDVLTSAEGKHHLTFGVVSLHLPELPELVQEPNQTTGENETEELVVLKGDETLAFPLHTEALHKYAAMLRSLEARGLTFGPAM